MTAMETDDLVVVTGPLKLPGMPVEESCVKLTPGEVARVVERETQFDKRGTAVRVVGLESGYRMWIDRESLTPLSEIQADRDVKWGDLLDPDYIHDYVFEDD